MKKKLLTLLFLATQTLAFAEGSALLITLKDGSKTAYLLSGKPSVTFVDDKLCVKVSDASTEYNRADVATFTFVDAGGTTGVQELAQCKTVFEYRNASVHAEGARIRVFSLDGKLLLNGTSTVSLSGLPSGVYVVKMNNQIVKVKK